MSKELMVIKVNEEGKKTVSAKELHEGLGLDSSQWARWYKTNIQNNNFFTENVDWVVLDTMSSEKRGNFGLDFAISIDFAKHIAMMAKTEKSHEYRNYFIECEKQLQPNTLVKEYLELSTEDRAILYFKKSKEVKVLNAEIAAQKGMVRGLMGVVATVGDLIQPRAGEISLNDVATQLGCYSVNGKPHGDFIFKILSELVRPIAQDQDCFSHRSGSTVLTDNYKHNVVLKVAVLGHIEDWINDPLNIHSTKGSVVKYRFLKSGNLSNVYPKPKEIDVEEVF